MDAVANIGAADGPNGEAQDVPSQQRFESRKSPSGKIRYTYRNAFFVARGHLRYPQRGHDRCVIAIKPENLDAWLDPDTHTLGV
jgi:hypothetical protein